MSNDCLYVSQTLEQITSLSNSSKRDMRGLAQWLNGLEPSFRTVLESLKDCLQKTRQVARGLSLNRIDVKAMKDTQE